ncbi:MAG: hypothetical protein J6D21_12045 [Clostridia bacterium]|nr:hypothetical protein [Clostridia bacterium]
MLEALKQKYVLCGSDGSTLRTLWAYLSYTSYSSRDGAYGRENSYYYTALTRDTGVEEGMFLWDGLHRYRVVSVFGGPLERVLRLVRRETFSYPSSDGGEFEFIYRAIRDRLGRDVLAGEGGVSLTFSVVTREDGVRTLTGELISRALTLGAAQTEALAVIGVLTEMAEDETSPLLSIRRGAFRYEQEESGSGFITGETLHICVKEDGDDGA